MNKWQSFDALWKKCFGSPCITVWSMKEGDAIYSVVFCRWDCVAGACGKQENQYWGLWGWVRSHRMKSDVLRVLWIMESCIIAISNPSPVFVQLWSLSCRKSWLSCRNIILSFNSDYLKYNGGDALEGGANQMHESFIWNWIKTKLNWSFRLGVRTMSFSAWERWALTNQRINEINQSRALQTETNFLESLMAGV